LYQYYYKGAKLSNGRNWRLKNIPDGKNVLMRGYFQVEESASKIEKNTIVKDTLSSKTSRLKKM
jgi:hypothetical protein